MAKGRYISFNAPLFLREWKETSLIHDMIVGLGVYDLPGRRRVYLEHQASMYRGFSIPGGFGSVRHVTRDDAKRTIARSRRLETG